MIEIDIGEKIIMTVRRHWFFLFSEVAVMVILLFLPLGFLYLFSNNNFLNINGDIFYLGLAIELMWILFVWLMFCKFWLDYYLDVWIITDKRLIDVEQKGFFHREISTVRLDKIEDMTVVVRGVIRSLLKFGEIRVQTAAESREFIMKDIANPYEVKNAILRLSDRMMNKNRE